MPFPTLLAALAAAPCVATSEPAVPYYFGKPDELDAAVRARLSEGDLPGAAELIAAQGPRDRVSPELAAVYGALEHPGPAVSPPKEPIAGVVNRAWDSHKTRDAVDAVRAASLNGAWPLRADGPIASASALRALLYREVLARDVKGLLSMLQKLRPVSVWVGPNERVSVDVAGLYAKELAQPGSTLWPALERSLLLTARGANRWLMSDGEVALAIEGDCAAGWRVVEADVPQALLPAAAPMIVDRPVSLEPGILHVARVCVPEAAEKARIGVSGPTTLALTTPSASVLGGFGVSATSADGLLGVRSRFASTVYAVIEAAELPIAIELAMPQGSFELSRGAGDKQITSRGQLAKSVSYGELGVQGKWPTCTAERDAEPYVEFPASIQVVKNCASGTSSGYRSSNYARETPQQQPTELHVIGTFRGTPNPKQGPETVSVHVAKTARPVALVLSSFNQVRWEITLERGARLKEIWVNDHHSTIPGNSGSPSIVSGVKVPVTHVDLGTYAYGWELDSQGGNGGYRRLIRHARELTGLQETTFQGCYDGKEFDVPGPSHTL